MAAVCLLLILFQQLILPLAESSNQECSLVFSEEPPSQLNCRPYDDNDNWRLRIACEVRIPVLQDFIEYEVHWFQKRNDTVIDHGRMGVKKSSTVERVAFGGNWINQKFSQNMTGDYWCQAILTGEQQHVFLPLSNILSIGKPHTYNRGLATCSSLHFIRKRRCILSTTNNEMTATNSTTQEQQPTLIIPTPETITSSLAGSSSMPIHIQSPHKSSQSFHATSGVSRTTKGITSSSRISSSTIIAAHTTTIGASMSKVKTASTNLLENPIDSPSQPLMLIIVIVIACALTLLVSILFGVMLFLINKWRQNKHRKFAQAKNKGAINCSSSKPYYVESGLRAEPYYIEPAVMSEPHYMTPVNPLQLDNKDTSHSSHSYESLASNTDYVSIYDSVTLSLPTGSNDNAKYYTAIDTNLIQNNIYTDLTK